MHGSSVHINAIDLVKRLTGYAEQVHPGLAHIPSQLFQQLLGVDNIERVVAEVDGSIRGDPKYQGVPTDFLITVLQACAHCARAVQPPDGIGWPALLMAERHAAVALAVHVASLDGAERLEALARARAEANRQQTAFATSTRTEPAKSTREFILSRARELKGSKKMVAAALADEVKELDPVRYSQPSVGRIQNYLSEVFPGEAWEVRSR